MRNKERIYVSISIPKSLAEEIDRLIGEYGYTSRAEIVKDAIRRYLNEATQHAENKRKKRSKQP
ncbi:MAG: ribbon-helix-helix domain-containing protein [Candidatus Bathyarchaeia archaeon]